MKNDQNCKTQKRDATTYNTKAYIKYACKKHNKNKPKQTQSCPGKEPMNPHLLTTLFEKTNPIRPTYKTTQPQLLQKITTNCHVTADKKTKPMPKAHPRWITTVNLGNIGKLWHPTHCYNTAPSTQYQIMKNKANVKIGNTQNAFTLLPTPCAQNKANAKGTPQVG